MTRIEPLRRGPDTSASTNSLSSEFREQLVAVQRDQQRVNQAIRAAGRGQALDNQSLIALQNVVYRYTQEVDLASRLADRLSQTVKTIVTSQQ